MFQNKTILPEKIAVEFLKSSVIIGIIKQTKGKTKNHRKINVQK